MWVWCGYICTVCGYVCTCICRPGRCPYGAGAGGSECVFGVGIYVVCVGMYVRVYVGLVDVVIGLAWRRLNLVFVRACVCVCIYVCMHIYVYIYIYRPFWAGVLRLFRVNVYVHVCICLSVCM